MKKIAVMILALTLLTVAFAAVPVKAIRPEVAYDPTYQFTHKQGSLGGADYEIFMPDSWNGHLIIGVRGYSHDEPAVTSGNMHTMGMTFMMSKAPTKYAYAWSTYGERGFCVKAGIVRTHQLTQYVVDNYDVPGKVLLIGFSMGGQIACMLAAKYPDQYDGVLDVCGNKDMATFYDYWKDLSLLPLNANQIKNFLTSAPTYIPTAVSNLIPDSGWLGMVTAASQVLSDVEIECGGPPETTPQFYERLSPTSNAHITIPVISMIARYDVIVPLQQQMDYYDAVEDSGALAYYRSYTISAGHCDSTMVAKVPVYFAQLYAWVTGLSVPPTPTPRPAA